MSSSLNDWSSGHRWQVLAVYVEATEVTQVPYAYVILTHGAKPQDDVKRHPAARQQLMNLTDFAEYVDKPENFLLAFDHSRRFECLDDLPILKSRLERAKEIGAKVIIDDFRRLTASCSNGNGSNLFSELREYTGHFLDIRTGRDIGALSELQTAIICDAKPPIKYVRRPTPRKKRTLDDRLDQTRKAKIASRIARGKAADAKAKELSELRQRLMKTAERVTNVELAEAANAEGLSTTRNNLWTAASVGRALKRLKESPKTMTERAKYKSGKVDS